MKIRQSFVANSSTVSFIIPFDKQEYIIEKLRHDGFFDLHCDKIETLKHLKELSYIMSGDSYDKYADAFNSGKMLYYKSFDNCHVEAIDDFESELRHMNIKYDRVNE